MKQKRRTTTEVVKALRTSGGFLSSAAEMLGISRTNISMRIEESDYLKRVMEEIEAQRLDLAEMALMKLIKAGNARAVIFFLKCKGQSMGYIEKREIAVDAKINHDDWVIRLEEADQDERRDHEQDKPERAVYRAEGRGHELCGDCQSAECIEAHVD